MGQFSMFSGESRVDGVETVLYRGGGIDEGDL